MFEALNGPAVYGNLTVTTTPQEVKVGAFALEERKVLTVQPIDGDVYIGYDSSVSSTTGTLIYEGMIYPLEAEDSLPVWIVSASGSVDVRITEVA